MTAREAALRLVRGYWKHNNLSALKSGAGGSADGTGDVRSYYAFCGGGWTIPGSKRLRAGFVGVWVSYQDGRFEGVEFSLDSLLVEIQQPQKPQQLRMMGF